MDIDQILAEIESDLAKDGFALAKADDDKDDAALSPPAAESAPPAGPPGGAPPDASAAPAGPPAADAPPDAPPPDASADPAAPADGSAGPPDMEALKAEYSDLPVDELQMHYVAIKAALMAKMGSQSPDMGAEASASAPPSAPPVDPSASSSAPVPAMKGEMSAVKPGLGSSASMAKSEQDMQLMSEKIEMLTKAMELVVGAPQRKSVKGVSELQFLSKGEEKLKKSEGLSKAQIQEKLSEKARDPKLSKSDKNAIVAFTIGTDLDLAKVEHLLA